MFGSRPTVGAVSIPATAPRSAASPQPSASIQVTRTPTSRASSGFTAAARSASPTFVNWKRSQRRKHDPESDGDRPDVVRRDDDAADVVGVDAERALELLRLAAPLPDDEAVDRDEEADRDDHDPQDAATLDRADHHAVDPDAADERDRERRDERRPVAPAVVWR